MKRCDHCGRELGDGLLYCPYDATALAGHRDPMMGMVIDGRYRVTGRVGVGGMATVYQAQHQSLGRDVAIKVLHPKVACDEGLVVRFAREARAATRIDHENVVYVLDFGCSEAGFFYLVMEHVAGIPLDAICTEQAPLDTGRVVHILAQIAAGIGRAHELGIIHRDLKPENIMLASRGNDRDFVKILDFGLSKAVDPEVQGRNVSKAGEVFGTPEFMPPEQWAGDEATPRTDLYALGATAFVMLTGRLPFAGTTALQLMYKHLQEPAPRASELAESVHGQGSERPTAGHYGGAQRARPCLGGHEAQHAEHHLLGHRGGTTSAWRRLDPGPHRLPAEHARCGVGGAGHLRRAVPAARDSWSQAP
jgi:serine/threonine-protein kinase